MASPPARRPWTLGRDLAVWEQTDRSMRRARALTVARCLNEVTAILQQAPNVNTCMLAAAGMAQALATLAVGARGLGAPLPPEVMDAVPELHGWATSVKARLRHVRVGASNAGKAFGAGIPSPSRPWSGDAPGPGASAAPWPRAHPRSLEESRHASTPARS